MHGSSRDHLPGAARRVMPNATAAGNASCSEVTSSRCSWPLLINAWVAAQGRSIRAAVADGAAARIARQLCQRLLSGLTYVIYEEFFRQTAGVLYLPTHVHIFWLEIDRFHKLYSVAMAGRVAR